MVPQHDGVLLGQGVTLLLENKLRDFKLKVARSYILILLTSEFSFLLLAVHRHLQIKVQNFVILAGNKLSSSPFFMV